jgi:ribokinase
VSIIVVGSTGIDFVAVTPHLPREGETVLATEDLYVGPGGKGFNQAAGAARLGAAVTFYTKIGSGDLGNQARSFLESEGLLGPSILVSDRPNQVALITVNETGNNTIAVAQGASADFTPSDLAALQLDGEDILLAQLEIPVDTVTEAARRARAAGATVVLNPAPAAPLPADLLELVDIATPNETELAILTGAATATMDQVIAAGRRLLEMGVGEVVATVGDRGAVRITGDASVIYEPLPVTAVDTTGAGDAFNAGLVVGLSRGLDVEQAIEIGNQAGAFCVTQLGVRDGLGTPEQLEALPAGRT